MFSRLAKDLLYLYLPMKCVTKCPLYFLKVEIVLGAILPNHTLAGPFSVVGNALHMISSETPCRCIRVLNDSKWSSGSFDPSYASTCSIQNLARRGKKVTCAMKGESIRWTSSSKLVPSHCVHHHIHLLFHHLHVLSVLPAGDIAFFLIFLFLTVSHRGGGCRCTHHCPVHYIGC